MITPTMIPIPKESKGIFVRLLLQIIRDPTKARPNRMLRKKLGCKVSTDSFIKIKVPPQMMVINMR
jgi:hypothetical protein